jgi:hypothetical protein
MRPGAPIVKVPSLILNVSDVNFPCMTRSSIPPINVQAEDSSLTHGIEGVGEEVEEQLLVLQRHSQQAVEEPVDLRQILLLDSQPANVIGFIKESPVGKRIKESAVGKRIKESAVGERI